MNLITDFCVDIARFMKWQPDNNIDICTLLIQFEWMLQMIHSFSRSVIFVYCMQHISAPPTYKHVRSNDTWAFEKFLFYFQQLMLYRPLK